MASTTPRSRDEVHIAVFCALGQEADEVDKVFDAYFDSLGKHHDDRNIYTLGAIGKHNVVLVHLGKTGLEAANRASPCLRLSFRNIKLAFVVGICGAVPGKQDDKVFLGDCFMSTGVVPYAVGTQHHSRHEKNIKETPRMVSGEARSFIDKLQHSARNKQKVEARISDQIGSKEKRGGICYPGAEQDRLYQSSFIHTHPAGHPSCGECKESFGVCGKSCQDLRCTERGIRRVLPLRRAPRLHFGIIGSADTLMKSGKHRDDVAREEAIVAFEMEGCGIWDDGPTIILRAASDYADSHKNDIWQTYAMAVAACALKAILEMLDHHDSVLVPETPSWPNTSMVSDSRMGSMHLRDESEFAPFEAAQRRQIPYRQPELITDGQPRSGYSEPLSISTSPATSAPSSCRNQGASAGPYRSSIDSDEILIGRLQTLKNTSNSSSSTIVLIGKLVSDLLHRPELIINGTLHDEYWSHMTLEGYDVYDKIYRLLCPNGGGADRRFRNSITDAEANGRTVITFAFALGDYLPWPEETIAKWRRFDRGVIEKLPKPYIMALLYMLHIEHFRSKHSFKRPKINQNLLDVLLAFDKWVSCPCKKCPLTWNFASKNWGWSKNGGSRSAENCLLYRRSTEFESHRSDSNWISVLKRDEARRSDDLRDLCFTNWYAAAHGPAQTYPSGDAGR